MKILISIIFIVTSLIGCNILKGNISAPDDKKKKLIGVGQEFWRMTPADLQNNKEKLEKLPFDGIAIGYNIATGSPNINYLYSDAFSDSTYEKKWFSRDIEVGKSFKSKILTDNFITVWGVSKTRIPWSDNKAWDRIANNVGVIAWFVKEIGFRGIVWDPEDYRKTDQFFFTSSLDGNYETASKLARKRGKQLMDAMVKENPTITFFTMFLMTLNWGEMNSNDPLAGSIAKGDLWFSFANGLLDGLKETATIIEGSESGYYLQYEEFFYETDLIRHKALSYVAPENISKYKNQVKAGTAIYLDMYANSEKSVWYYGPIAGSRAAKLRENLFHALNASDKYVWTWNEKAQWASWDYSTQNKNSTMRMRDGMRNWEEVIPGINNAIKLAKNPFQEAKIILTEKKDSLKQLNRLPLNELIIDNKTFNGTQKEMPTGWITREDGSLYAAHVLGINKKLPETGIENGFFYQIIDVNYGEWYAIEGLWKELRNSNVNLLIAWGPASSKGTFHFAHEVILAFNQPAENVWREAFDVVQVPRGAVRMYFFICCRNLKPDAQLTFKNLGVYKLQ